MRGHGSAGERRSSCRPHGRQDQAWRVRPTSSFPRCTLTSGQELVRSPPQRPGILHRHLLWSHQKWRPKLGRGQEVGALSEAGVGNDAMSRLKAAPPDTVTVMLTEDALSFKINGTFVSHTLHIPHVALPQGHEVGQTPFKPSSGFHFAVQMWDKDDAVKLLGGDASSPGLFRGLTAISAVPSPPTSGRRSLPSLDDSFQEGLTRRTNGGYTSRGESCESVSVTGCVLQEAEARLVFVHLRASGRTPRRMPPRLRIVKRKARVGSCVPGPVPDFQTGQSEEGEKKLQGNGVEPLDASKGSKEEVDGNAGDEEGQGVQHVRVRSEGGEHERKSLEVEPLEHEGAMAEQTQPSDQSHSDDGKREEDGAGAGGGGGGGAAAAAAAAGEGVGAGAGAGEGVGAGAEAGAGAESDAEGGAGAEAEAEAEAETGAEAEAEAEAGEQSSQGKAETAAEEVKGSEDGMEGAAAQEEAPGAVDPSASKEETQGTEEPIPESSAGGAQGGSGGSKLEKQGKEQEEATGLTEGKTASGEAEEMEESKDPETSQTAADEGNQHSETGTQQETTSDAPTATKDGESSEQIDQLGEQAGQTE
eukprot:754437-Hanusia_phi.AAC.3